MHLIYVTAAAPFSFDETFIVPEIRALERYGHQVTVVPVRPVRDIFHGEARGLTAVARPVLSPSILAGALAETLRRPARVVRCALRVLVASRSPRIALKNAAVLPKGVWLARLARQRGVDHIHAHWAGTSATAALVASEISGVPWSLTAHRWDISENNLLREKARATTFVRVIDAQGEREMAPYVTPVPEKLCRIRMGVLLPEERPRPQLRQEGPLRVLLGARLVEVKGHRYALMAIARLRAASIDVTLDCAGHGPLRDRLEREALDLGLTDRVRFLGVLDHGDLLSRLRDDEWDVVLLPSIRNGTQREGIPVMLIEAMAAGLPVVATSTGGIPELLESGAGIEVPERDPAAIADALARLAADPELRRRLSRASVRRAREQYCVQATAVALTERFRAAPGRKAAAAAPATVLSVREDEGCPGPVETQR